MGQAGALRMTEARKQMASTPRAGVCPQRRCGRTAVVTTGRSATLKTLVAGGADDQRYLRQDWGTWSGVSWDYLKVGVSGSCRSRAEPSFGCVSSRRRPPKAVPPAFEEVATVGWLNGLAVVKTIRCRSNRTRPVSWLGPISFGTHPRTKGTRCFAGRRRRRLPFDPDGSPGNSLVIRQGARGPIAGNGRD